MTKMTLIVNKDENLKPTPRRGNLRLIVDNTKAIRSEINGSVEYDIDKHLSVLRDQFDNIKSILGKYKEHLKSNEIG